jgi:hypothetical protein
VCVSVVTKKNAWSLYLRQRTSLSSGRPALRYPVVRHAVWGAHKALLAVTGLRTFHNAVISVITLGHDRGLAKADHRSPGWLKLLAIQAVAPARVNL